MSLKAFHILFMVLSIILALGFGYWGVRDFQTYEILTNLWLGIGSLVIGVSLAGYLVWFIQKSNRLQNS